MTDLKVEYLRVDNIYFYEKNAKEHPEKQIQQIAASIKEFGFTNPVLIDEANEIIAGHGRVEAAKIMGLTEVPIIKLQHLSEAQKRAYRLADNKISENSGWNEDTLKLELSELESLCNDFDITITGFDDIEIDVLLDDTAQQTKEDEKLNNPPFVPENEIVSKFGDIWQLGEHRIICGNSLEEDTFKKLMQDKLADMILQDPPFNLANNDIGNLGKTKHASFAMAAGEMSDSEFTTFLSTNFKLCAKNSKDGSLHFEYMDFRHLSHILAAGKEAFSSLINMCIWNKGVGGLGSLYRSAYECCLLFKKGTASHTNNVQLGSNGRYRTNVWNYPGVNSFGRNKDNLKLHPTTKNVSMLYDAILDVSKRGELVLDCFLGSGSTLIAAHKAKRICYGIEFEPLYIDTTIRRFQDLFKINAVRETDGRTYNECLDEIRKNNLCIDSVSRDDRVSHEKEALKNPY